jgi:hypothetical protein
VYRFLVAGSEVLIAVVMKSSVFWGMTPCSPLKIVDISDKHIGSIFMVKE